MQHALETGDISEGHTRPLLMLTDKPEEQRTLFKEIIERRLTVRDTEALARRSAVERVRHKALLSPDLLSLEKQLSERLGTRVRIERKETGGKLLIDFFSPEDLTQLCLSLTKQEAAAQASAQTNSTEIAELVDESRPLAEEVAVAPVEEKAQMEKKDDAQDDLYSIRNFSV